MPSRVNQWNNDKSLEQRVRCRAQEWHGKQLVQCMGDRRVPHVHLWRGKPFKDQS